MNRRAMADNFIIESMAGAEMCREDCVDVCGGVDPSTYTGSLSSRLSMLLSTFGVVICISPQQNQEVPAS